MQSYNNSSYKFKNIDIAKSKYTRLFWHSFYFHISGHHDSADNGNIKVTNLDAEIFTKYGNK